MFNVKVTFQQRIESLREAVTHGEIESIRLADDEIRAHIEEIAQASDVLMAKQELEQLLDEYQEFIVKVEGIQQRLGDRLRDVQRGTRASNKYHSMMKPTAA